MSIRIKPLINILGHPNNGPEFERLVTATRDAETESDANQNFLNKAAKIGAEANISNSVPLMIQH